MSARGVLKFEDVGVFLRRVVGILHRPLWTDPENGGLRVGTVVSANVLTTAESLSADCPLCSDPVIEEGQVDPPLDPLQGLTLVYEAKTGDRACYALTVGARIS